MLACKVGSASWNFAPSYISETRFGDRFGNYAPCISMIMIQVAPCLKSQLLQADGLSALYPKP